MSNTKDNAGFSIVVLFLIEERTRERRDLLSCDALKYLRGQCDDELFNRLPKGGGSLLDCFFLCIYTDYSVNRRDDSNQWPLKLCTSILLMKWGS